MGRGPGAGARPGSARRGPGRGPGRHRGGEGHPRQGGGRPGARPAHGAARAGAPAAEPGARRARRAGAPREGSRGPGSDAGGPARGGGREQGGRDRRGREGLLRGQQGALRHDLPRRTRCSRSVPASASSGRTSGAPPSRGSSRRSTTSRILLEPYRVPVETGSAPSRGNPKAPVTILEFSDFQCPYCVRARPVVNQVREAYGDKVRFVFRHFPLDFHAQAQKAGEAAACAGEQGKFWEMHDLLWENASKLQVADLKAHAGALGLDGAAFDDLPRLRPPRRPRRARPRGGAGLRRLRHAGVLRQRAAARRRPALRGLRAGDRRRARARGGQGPGRRREVSAGEDGRPAWLRFAQRIQAIAQAGLAYAAEPYDRERYEELRRIAVDMAADRLPAPGEDVRVAFASGLGYPTPKVDVRAVVFRDEELLLVRERKSSRWTFPGGWADAGDTPSHAAERETLEESGYRVRAEKLLALLDKSRHAHPPSIDYTYKVLIRCRARGRRAPHEPRDRRRRLLRPRGHPRPRPRPHDARPGGPRLRPPRRPRASDGFRLSPTEARPAGTRGFWAPVKAYRRCAVLGTQARGSSSGTALAKSAARTA